MHIFFTFDNLLGKLYLETFFYGAISFLVSYSNMTPTVCSELLQNLSNKANKALQKDNKAIYLHKRRITPLSIISKLDTFKAHLL